MTQFDVTSLGECMLRLSAPYGERLNNVQSLRVHPGGAEANVCAALAALGRRTAWAGRLPDNDLGHLVLSRLRGSGIDTRGVTLTPSGRLGLYFVEPGGAPRATRVIYDRQDSVAADMGSETIDWNYLLDTRLLHLTGVTPALSEGNRVLAAEAIRRAREVGVSVSFDLNLRRHLWSDDEAARILRPLVEESDLLLANRRDAQTFLRCAGHDPHRLLELLQQATGARHIVLTLGEEGVLAVDDGGWFEQAAIPANIVDRLGAGDALAAGIIDGWLDGQLVSGLKRGVVLAAIALSQLGDMISVTRGELEQFSAGTDGTHVHR